MTCKEWMEKNRPYNVNDQYIGGVFGCPDDYGLDVDLICNGDKSNVKLCAKCWDQELHAPDIPSGSMVDHPSHYQGKHECIDEMIAMFGVEAVKAFCKCNVYKYRYRADKKNGEEDLAKADWYMDKLMELEKIDEIQP